MLTKEEMKQIADSVNEKIDTEIGKLEKSINDKKQMFGQPEPADELRVNGFKELSGFDKETKIAAVKFGRFVKGISLGNMIGAGPAVDAIKKMYPKDKMIQEAVGKALGVTVPSEGGYTVPSILIADMIPLLYSRLAVKKLGARIVPMPNGNANIPRLNTGSTFSWIGESKVVPKTQPAIGNVKLSGKKGGCLVPISNDLLRSAELAADLWVTNDVVIQLQLGLDYAAMYGLGTAYQPFGLNNLVVSGNKLGSSTTKLTADIPGQIIGQLMALNIPMVSCGWIFGGYVWSWLFNLKTTTGAYIYRDEMSAGKLLGFPYVVCNQIPVTNPTGYGSTMYTDLFFGDFNEFLWGEQLAMEIVASKEASYDDGTGTLVSAFAQDQTVIRALTVVDFNIRHTTAFIKGTYQLSA
jgi:HK97 family phage major capsid protein